MWQRGGMVPDDGMTTARARIEKERAEQTGFLDLVD